MADEGSKRVHLPVINADKYDVGRQLDLGGLYNHGMHTFTLDQLHQLATFVFAGLELMIAKGVITRDEMRVTREAVAEKLDATHWTRTHGLQMTYLEPGKSKYEMKGSLVDCDARMHLCKGVCCYMDHPLQLEDIVEGVVKWDHEKPYWIRHHADGRCVHVDGGGRCDVFEQRPKVCRTYTCEDDARVWIDFAGRVPNTASIEKIFAKPAAKREAMTQAAVERVSVAVSRPTGRPVDMSGDGKGGQGGTGGGGA
jgi:Fe-S-cluster containining protein